MQGVRVSVYQKANERQYYWYREANDIEKQSGHHIVVDVILSERQLKRRLRGFYGRT
jgi:hypothetical protein